MSSVSALFTGEVLRVHGRADWSQLAQCALWAEREPRLLTASAPPPAARWGLFWGLAHVAQWERTERMWTQIREVLDLPADVAAVLDVWVSGRGRVATGAAAGLTLRPPREG